jgi:hypothetical protein
MGCDVVATSGSLAGEELQFQDAKGSTCLPWYGMTILMAAKGSRRPATEARERRAAGGTWRKEKKHAENMSLLPFVQTGLKASYAAASSMLSVVVPGTPWGGQV